MTQVKAVGRTSAQSADAQGLSGGVSLGKDPSKDHVANTETLVSRHDVEVIKEPLIAIGLDHHKADALLRHFDVPCVSGREAGAQSLTRSHGVEAPGLLEALAHGKDSKRCQ